MTKTALIIGVTGQDGALLADNLVKRGIKVHGTHRVNTANFWRLEELKLSSAIHLHQYDIGDDQGLRLAISNSQPDFIFSLAGESFSANSFNAPKEFMKTNVGAVMEQLEAFRELAPYSKIFFAGSAEIFGESSDKKFLDENSSFKPVTPYGISKLTQHHLVELYRNKFNLNLYNGILFPHESTYRSPNFVTRKIVVGLAQRKFLNGEVLQLGDLSMKRDWGRATQYVDLMFRLLDECNPDDFIFGTGTNTSVEEFLLSVASNLGLNLEKKSTSKPEITEYFDVEDGKTYVISDQNKFPGNRFSYSPASPRKIESALKVQINAEIEILAGEMVLGELDRMNIHST